MAAAEDKKGKILMEKKNIDWSNLGFGYVKTDKRFVSNYKNGAWDEGARHETTLIPEYVDEDVYQMGVLMDRDNPVISSVSKDSPAESAGIKSGDKILSINGTAVSVTDEVSPLVNASGDSELTLVVERDGSEVTIKITPNKVHQAYYQRHVGG